MKLTYKHIPGTLALIDGDVLVYRIGFTTEDTTEEIATVRLNAYIDEILHKSHCADYQIFLSCPGQDNFRTKLYRHYKQGRAPKPKHYQALRDYLIKYEEAVVSEDMEADDEMGIRQDDTTIICTIDKDLDMIEGRHFNFVKNKHYMVDPATAMRNFYKQLLTGDKTDMIPGIYGLGPAKAEKLLANCYEKDDYEDVVFETYCQHFDYCSPEDILEHINLVGRLLWIKRKPDEEWSFGNL